MKFIKSGLQTSIQDLGRIGQMHLGIACGGAMDPDSLKMANWLVNNPADTPAIEVTLIGPTIRFSQAAVIAICGAEFELFLNQRPIKSFQPVQVKRDDILVFGQRLSGCRAYLAISRKLNLKRVLSSYSTHLLAKFGGYKGRPLLDGDELNLLVDKTIVVKPNETDKHFEKRSIPSDLRANYSGHYYLRCVSSVESSQFSESQLDYFYKQSYQIDPQSNRMGIRLIGGESVMENKIQITSSGLTQGSIQLPPSGQPIISSVDGQTIGGYPRIANVISADLALLGQLTAGNIINFVKVEPEQGIQLLQEKQQLLSILQE